MAFISQTEYNMILRLKETLDVYTGTYGILSMLDVNGNEQDIFLYNEDGKKWIPAPKYYWKVVYSQKRDEGVAVIGINNPHESERPTELCSVRFILLP